MDQLIIPTILFGTSQGARSSAVLQQSAGLDDLPQGEARFLGAFPLAFAKWLRQREVDEAFGCLPLGYQASAGRLLFRCLYQTELGNEPIGLATGLYLSPQVLAAVDYHPERLLHLLPSPGAGDGDQGAAGTAPLIVPASQVLPGFAGLSSGLEWRNIAVQVPPDCDPLAPLCALLAGVTDPRLQMRVMGWTTSARFAKVGVFNPELAFQLVVSTVLPAEGAYHQVAWRDGTLVGEPIPDPPSWAAWQQVAAVVQDSQPLAEACAWSPLFIDLAAADIVPRLEERLLGDGEPGAGQYLELLLRLGAAGLLSDPGARLVQAIEACDGDQRQTLLAAVFDLAPDFAALLGVQSYFFEYPARAMDLPFDRFTKLLDRDDWLLSPHLRRSTIGHLSDEQLRAALTVATVAIAQAQGPRKERYHGILRDLLGEFIKNDRIAVQRGPEAFELVERLDRVGAKSLLQERDQRRDYVQIQRDALRYFAPQPGAAQVSGPPPLTVPPHLPRNQDEVDDLLHALDLVLAAPEQPGTKKRRLT